MTSVFVTGGAGFIGAHTCLKLLENGFDVFVIDICYKTSFDKLERVQEFINKKLPKLSNKLYLFKGDIRDQNLLEGIFKKAIKIDKKINAVIHLAGLKSVYESINDPLTYWDNNLCGAISLLKVMNLNNCNIIVFSSSATIYDTSKNELIKEDENIKPINPYGKNKVAIESFLQDIYNSNKNIWKIANLRYFNPVGAHPDGIIGEDSKGDASNLFPNIIQVAKGHRKFINVYGNDWPSKDGTCIRDYVHVMDLADGHIKALNYLFSNNHKLINLNLGSGIGKSVLEVIKTFEEINSVKIPYLFANRREGDRSRVIADIELSKKILKWEPIYSLSDMCRDAWNWDKLIN